MENKILMIKKTNSMEREIKKLGTRYTELEKELEKHNVIWEDPFGYQWLDSIKDEFGIRTSKICTLDEVEKIIDKIADDNLRGYGVAPELLNKRSRTVDNDNTNI